MPGHRVLLFMLLAFGAQLFSGCGSSKQELPTQEKIQQQLKRDAAMRDAEDQLDKEKTGGRRK
jgi:hypothetical protein